MASKRQEPAVGAAPPPARKPKPWSWRQVEDIELAEWVLVLRKYVLYGMFPPGSGQNHRTTQEVGYPRLVKVGGIQAVEIVGGIGPRQRGRPRLPRWHATDDLYPVLGFAAHGLAWKLRGMRGTIARLSEKLGCAPRVIELARTNPSDAVADLILAFRGEPVSYRTLKHYRSLWRLTLSNSEQLHPERRLLEWSVRFFLQRCPASWLPSDTCNPPCRNRNAHHGAKPADL